ncbi:hypothetical protein V1517DRAFT_334292, partial [Lipomyces orientalis]
MTWVCAMFFSLQLVRNNIQNAISADFLIDASIVPHILLSATSEIILTPLLYISQNTYNGDNLRKRW